MCSLYRPAGGPRFLGLQGLGRLMRSAYINLLERYAKNVSHRPLDHFPAHISYRLAGGLVGRDLRSRTATE